MQASEALRDKALGLPEPGDPGYYKLGRLMVRTPLALGCDLRAGRGPCTGSARASRVGCMHFTEALPIALLPVNRLAAAARGANVLSSMHPAV